MQLFIVTLLVGVAHAIIDGEIADKNEFPFAVALMHCTRGPEDDAALLCSYHCSGALIATNAVVTAGHCLENVQQTPTGPAIPVVPVDELYVLAGTSNYDEWDGAKLVKASSFVNKGYGKNLRFEGDNDMGIVFLEECVAIHPGVIETIPVATDSDGTDCGDTITILGFGKNSNAATALSLPGGSYLKSAIQTVHSFATCSEMYVLSESRGGTPNPDALLVMQQAVLPEHHLCSSGTGIACFGDSGGPGFVTKADGSRLLVSINMYGHTLPGMFCSGAPFAFKLAGSAGWIEQQLAKHSGCSPVKDSFNTYPLPEIKLSEKTALTRCHPGQWQCESGACIDKAFVCDGSDQCADGTDERLCPRKKSNGNFRNQRQSGAAQLRANGPPSAASNWSAVEAYAMRRYGHKAIKVSANEAYGYNPPTKGTPMATVKRKPGPPVVVPPWAMIRPGGRGGHATRDDVLESLLSRVDDGEGIVEDSEAADAGKLRRKRADDAPNCLRVFEELLGAADAVRDEEPPVGSDYDIARLKPLCNLLDSCEVHVAAEVDKLTDHPRVAETYGLCKDVDTYFRNTEIHDSHMDALEQYRDGECVLHALTEAHTEGFFSIATILEILAVILLGIVLWI